MQVHNVNLTISAVEPKQYPSGDLPEIAFAGRSNVGKSTLINSLFRRKNYARTSSQPGKTQTLNFYNLEDVMYFVDIPGYGYAKVSQKERERWGKMIETYLTSRTQLQGVISLVDARHEPTELDVQMIDFLHYYRLPVLVVGTKLDKIKRSQYNKAESTIRKKLHLAADELVLFSAVTKENKDKIWQWINTQANVNLE